MIVVELGHSILVFQQSLVGIWRLTFRVLGVDIGVIEVTDIGVIGGIDIGVIGGIDIGVIGGIDIGDIDIGGIDIGDIDIEVIDIDPMEDCGNMLKLGV